tara:strand:+ start:118 stop:450 length:333 start_codon:yes stop_codon:yes gene_type:complete
LYIYPGSLIGLVIYGDKKIQPQITPDFVISSNHFYVFIVISIIGFLSYTVPKQINYLTIYLIIISIFLELSHLIIPGRVFQWSDLFGNFLGVVIVILINKFINKYEFFNK